MNREAVYEQLKIDEGVVYGIYNDHLGYPTFGVGHLILEDDEEFGRPVGTAVTEERVRACFARDLSIAEGECYTLYGEGVFRLWPDEVQQIMVNMMFSRVASVQNRQTVRPRPKARGSKPLLPLHSPLQPAN